jgi:hypothetical protein
MGCSYEINDTLLLSADQGFPTDVFSYERHVKNPVTTADVEGKIFSFKGKPAARAFQLDPVRVYFVENTDQGKWLVWGKAFIESLTIEHVKTTTNPNNAIQFQPGDWMTSGTFKVVEVYDPEYQKIFTSHETPAAWNFFGS